MRERSKRREEEYISIERQKANNTEIFNTSRVISKEREWVEERKEQGGTRNKRVGERKREGGEREDKERERGGMREK